MDQNNATFTVWCSSLRLLIPLPQQYWFESSAARRQSCWWQLHGCNPASCSSSGTSSWDTSSIWEETVKRKIIIYKWHVYDHRLTQYVSPWNYCRSLIQSVSPQSQCQPTPTLNPVWCRYNVCAPQSHCQPTPTLKPVWYWSNACPHTANVNLLQPSNQCDIDPMRVPTEPLSTYSNPVWCWSNMCPPYSHCQPTPTLKPVWYWSNACPYRAIVNLLKPVWCRSNMCPYRATVKFLQPKPVWYWSMSI